MPCFGIPTDLKTTTTIAIFMSVLMLPQVTALSWNIPGHMLSGTIAYQILRQESPTTIPAVRSVLDKNPWYETRWKVQLEKFPDVMKCSSSSPHVGPMIFARGTKPRAVCRGTT
jgi:hypothetical protein